MNYIIDIQRICDFKLPISDATLEHWAKLPLAEEKEHAELTLRIVDENEIQLLNKTYRQKDKPTNVLAFPSTLPEGIQQHYPLLGDVVICPLVLKKESDLLNKPFNEHFAHIVIHGVLHLLGYDHIEEIDEKKMQTREIELLATLGIDNPYEEG